MTSPCPSESALSDLVAGDLPAGEAAALREHIDGCTQCRKALAEAEAGLTTMDHAPSARPAPRPLVPGTKVSRYVVLEQIGSGGMGVVYSAFDPQLNRRVALKLLNLSSRSARSEEARTRLLREAQTLAKLSHPNVVAVHDAGTHGDDVFLAMDFVDGASLRQWLHAEPRPWRTVVEVFLAAGRGLAAAHAAKLVHRDFKPDNVLVGRDGSVRVTDFGLARVAPREDGDDEGPELSESAEQRLRATGLEDTLTREGQVVGTPAYMPPEQVRGERADARSDQFSFCVALYQALYGVHPYPGATAKARTAAAEAGVLNPPKDGVSVPPRVRRPLRRGLQAVPSERYPSMEPLLQDLERAASSFRRRWAFAAGVVATAVAAALLTGYLGARREQLCTGAALSARAVWSDERRAQMHQAFLATKAVYANSAWAAAEQTLDEYVRGWERMQTEACEATRLRREQSEDQLGLRTACLDRRLQDLKALTDMFVRADAEVVDRAPEAARALEGLSGCANLVALNTRVRPPADPAIAAQLTGVQAKLAEGKALHEAGKFQAALGVLGPAAEELERLGYRPEWGRALYLRARAEQMLSRSAAAEESLYQAMWAAEEGRDDELKALTWIQLIETVGVSQARLKEARRLALHASAAVARLGKGVDPDIEADLHMRLGQLSLGEADGDQAFAELEQARRLLEGKHGPAHPGLVRVLLSQASALGRKGHYEASLDLYRRAMAITEASLGPAHPELASVHNNLASALYSLARWEEAGRHYQRALEIYQTNFGPEDRRVGQTRHNLSGLLRAEGKVHEALAQSEAALVILEKSVGPSHPHVARASLNAATCLMDLHREDEALRHARRALDIWRGLGPDHADTALALRVIGKVLFQQRRLAAAREAFEQAVAVMERNHREDSPVLASILVELARIDLSTGQPRQALQRAERARAIAEPTLGAEHPGTGDAYLAEGRARLALGDSEKALPLLRQARAIMDREKKNGPERRELDEALPRAEAASARRSHRP